MSVTVRGTCLLERPLSPFSAGVRQSIRVPEHSFSICTPRMHNACISSSTTALAGTVHIQSASAKPIVEDIQGFVASFLLPSTKTVGFMMGRSGSRVRELQRRHELEVAVSPKKDKYLREVRITARKPQVVAAFFEDLLTMAEQGNELILDTTRDGEAYRLKMKVPKRLCGHLLGNNGETIKVNPLYVMLVQVSVRREEVIATNPIEATLLQGISERTGCLLKLQSVQDSEAQQKDSDFRVLQFAASHTAMIAAVKEVLMTLCDDPRFRFSLAVPGFVTVPQERVADVEELLPDIRAKIPGLLRATWMKPPRSVVSISEESKRLMFLGPASAVAEAKEQLEGLWGQPDWSPQNWPGLFSLSRSGVSS